jgi:L-alanine-DL-glutamate epimerase-like enolase superfamily enzyme
VQASLKTLHLRDPFRIAHGTSSTRQVLRITHEGHTSEAPFVPYHGEDPQQTLALLNDVILPADLSGTTALAVNFLRHDLVQALMPRMACSLSRPAILALNLMYHELLGCNTGESLRQHALAKLGPSMLGTTPPGCHSIGIPADLDVFEDKIRQLSTQFSVLKLKLGSGDLGLDLATVSVARHAAPDAKLILDVNGGWDLVEAPLMIEKLAHYEPALIEQPIHHRHGIEAWEDLRSRLPGNPPPIFADESVQTASDVPALAPYIDGVNVKLLKCSSFDAAITMIETARTHNLQILLGCMIETSLGITAAAHLAPWVDWIDLDGHLHITNDDFTGIEYDAHGRLLMPDRPGIGAIPR